MHKNLRGILQMYSRSRGELRERQTSLKLNSNQEYSSCYYFLVLLGFWQQVKSLPKYISGKLL